MEDLFILFILLLLSAFFSGSETALTSLSKVRAEALLAEGRTGAQALHALKSNTDRMLIAILIGNNLVNIASSAMATLLATEAFGDLGPGLAVGGLTLVILIFGEITPKTFATRHAAPISLFVSPPLLFFARLVTPLVWALEKLTALLQRLSSHHADPTITETELISLARHGAEEGAIEPGEEKLINRIFHLNDLTAGDIMTPRHRIVSMTGTRTIREALPDFLAQHHSRIPLHHGQLEEITKVVYLREILEEVAQGNWEKTLFEAGHEPLFAPENQPIDELLDLLRTRKRQLILVVDALGVLQGLFSLEDVLEELVGEIQDKGDPAWDQVTEVEPGVVLVDGAQEVRVLEDHFQHPLGGKPTDSVNEWILDQVGRIPRVDETFTIDGLTVQVIKASRRSIHKVRVSLAAPNDHSGKTDDP